MISQAPQAKISNAERQMKLLLFIREHGPVSRQRIFSELHEYELPNPESSDYASALAATRRKFIRDKESLEQCGFFITCDANDRYRVDMRASYAVPVDLSDAQAALLRYACCSLLSDPSYVAKDDLRMALIKISDEIEAPDMLPLIEEHTASRADKTRASNFAKICKAIDMRKLLSFDYKDRYGKDSSRQVEPFGAFTLDKNLYLVAYDRTRKADRYFRLDRMSRIKEVHPTSNTPEFEERPFDADEWITLPFQIGAQDFTATIRFESASCWRMKRTCLRFGTLEEAEDGSGIWTVAASDVQAAASWCIAAGPGVVPVAPDELVNAYQAGIAAAWEACQ